jgi:hypothetical protein
MRSLYEIIILLQGRTAYKIDTKFFWDTEYDKILKEENQ